MANMTYCMFENTAGDLADVVARLQEEDPRELVEDLNEYELQGLREIVQLCWAVVQMAEEGRLPLRRLGVE